MKSVRFNPHFMWYKYKSSSPTYNVPLAIFYKHSWAIITNRPIYGTGASSNGAYPN